MHTLSKYGEEIFGDLLNKYAQAHSLSQSDQKIVALKLCLHLLWDHDDVPFSYYKLFIPRIFGLAVITVELIDTEEIEESKNQIIAQTASWLSNTLNAGHGYMIIYQFEESYKKRLQRIWYCIPKLRDSLLQEMRS